MIQDELKDIITKYNIVHRSMKLFWEYIDELMNNEQEELHSMLKLNCRDKIYASVHTISYNLDNWPNINDNHVAVIISAVYENEGIGNYEIIFSVDGKQESKRFERN